MQGGKGGGKAQGDKINKIKKKTEDKHGCYNFYQSFSHLKNYSTTY